MDIKEVQLKKRELQQQITVLLQKFEEQTGLNVESVSHKRSGIVRGFALPKIQEVIVKVLL